MIAVRTKTTSHEKIVENVEHAASEKKSTQDISHVKNLLSILNPNRVSNNYDLIVLTSLVKNFSSELYDSMVEYLRKSQYNPTESEIQSVWNEKTLSNVTVATLKWWLITDDRQLYLRTVVESMKQLYIRERYTTNDVAMMIFVTFGHMHKTGSSRSSYKKLFNYVFIDGRWKHSDSWHIDLDVINGVSYQINHLFASIAGTNLVLSQDTVKFVSTLTQLLTKLNSVVFMDNIVRFVNELSYDKDVLNLMDADTNLIGFNNGVYDLTINSLRQATPDDLISVTTGNDFITDDVSESEEFKEKRRELTEYLSTVFVDPSGRDYVLRSVAMTLVGRSDTKIHKRGPKPINVMKQVVSSSGTTSFLNLIKNSFGGYLKMMSCNYQDHMWIEIAKSFGHSARVVICDTSYSQQSLQGLIRSIIFAQRNNLQCYGNDFTPIVITGPGEFEKFQVTTPTDGVKFVVHPFESSFVDVLPDPMLDGEDDVADDKVFLSDHTICDKTSQLSGVLLRLLIEQLKVE